MNYTDIEREIEDIVENAGLKCLINIDDECINISISNVGFDFRVSLFSSGEWEYTWLSNFFIRKECRNKGLGTHVLKVCEKISKTLNVKYIMLRVDENNIRAMNLYRRVGYELHYKNEEGIFLKKYI